MCVCVKEGEREGDRNTERERTISISDQVFLEVEPESRIPVQVVYYGNGRKTWKGLRKVGLGKGNSGLGSGEAPDSSKFCRVPWSNKYTFELLVLQLCATKYLALF